MRHESEFRRHWGTGRKREPPHDWNVVVTVNAEAHARARRLLAGLGAVHLTPYYNVLVMRVDDGQKLLEVLRNRTLIDPAATSCLSRVVPLSAVFDFESPREFELKAGEAALGWVDEVAGRSFHVRLHRRGLKGQIVSPEEERLLDRLLVDETGRIGRPARVDFEGPEFIIAAETVGHRGGLSIWTREDRARYPLLGLS